MKGNYGRFAKPLVGGALCYLSTGIGPVLAQQVADQGDSQASGMVLEEVVVTARKREENLLETPVTVTALTSEDLVARNIDDLAAVAQYTPGLTLNALSNSRNDRSNQSLIIRGMTPDFAGNVSVFIDGAPVVGQGFVSGLDDLARVEVLKGPQSATFGRATFAGAINLVTNDPRNEFHASVDTQVMTYSGRDIRASVEGPIIPDKLSFLMQVRDYSTDGTYLNAANPAESLGAQSTRSISLILKAQLGQNFSNKLLYNYWIDNDGVAPNYLITNRQYNCAAGAAGKTLNYTCGQLPSADFNYLADNDQIDSPVENALFRGRGSSTYAPLEYLPNMGPGFSDHMGLERRAYHLSDIVEFDIPSIDASLISNSSLDVNRYEETLDVDDQNTSNMPSPTYTPASVTTLQPFVNWPFFNQVSNVGYSEDLRLQGGAHQRLHWSLGLSYLSQTTAGVTGALLDTGTANFQPPSRTIDETDGVFASVGYDIFSKLTVSLEARYQNDHQQADSFRGASRSFFFVVSEDQTSFIPRGSVQYRFQPNWMVYASYGVGVNPGGFNSNLLQYTPAQQAALSSTFGANLQIQPEKLYSAELGIKGTFWNERAELTADVYRADWKNQIVANQVSISNIAGIPAGSLLGVSENIGRTLLYGTEFEGKVIVAKGLTLHGGFAYTPSRIQQYVCLICKVSISGSTDVHGNQLPQVPAVSGNISAEYERPLTSSVEGYIRADGVYQGRIYEDPTNLAWIPSTGHANLHIGVTRGNVQVEGFVTNVFDNLGYIQVGMYENLIAGFSNDATPALPPRRIVGLRYRQSW